MLVCVAFALAASPAGTGQTGDTGIPASDTATLTETVTTGGTAETASTADTGAPEEEISDEEAVVTAASLAGEVGGVRCDSVGVGPTAGWLVLLLAAIRRARGVS